MATLDPNFWSNPGAHIASFASDLSKNMGGTAYMAPEQSRAAMGRYVGLQQTPAQKAAISASEASELRRFQNKSASGKPASAGGDPGDDGTSSLTLEEIMALLGLGGGGGGGGGYDPRPGIREQYAQQRDSAARRKGETSTELGNIYTGLANAYKPISAQTQQRYTDAGNAAQAGSQGLISATQARINEEAAKRAAAFGELGIAGPAGQEGASTGVAAEAEYNMGNLSNTAANWGGLLGAQGQAERGRNDLDYTGAVDSGALAQDQLTRNYNAYLDNLGAQEAQALAGAVPSGGGGGGGGSSLPAGVQNLLWGNALQQMGIDASSLLGTGDSGSSYTPSKYEQAMAMYGPDAVAAYTNSKNTGNMAGWMNNKLYDPGLQWLLK